MKIALKLLFVGLFCWMVAPAYAQVPENIMTESSDPIEFEDDDYEGPVDDIVTKRITAEKRVLSYDPIREADIFWEKRIWRVVDVREKMNLSFAYPERPFFTILMEAAMSSDVTAYSTEDDKFTTPLTPDEVGSMGATQDTVITFDPETYEEQIQIVRNEINPEDLKRFRLKEIFLGIAPLRDITDDAGNFLYEQPMFWIYYPEAREILARERVYNYGNDASPITWEDMLEMRAFASYIFKESNVYDRRLQSYLTGVDLLLEADKIKQQIFNFEHDLWSY